MFEFTINNRWTKKAQFTMGLDDSFKTKSLADQKGAAVLKYISINGEYLSGARLAGADLYGAYLYGADLSGAYLSGADLSSTRLIDANLSGANLSGTDLYGAYLSGADLSDADLTGANLTRADLTDADLTDANLTGAYLIDANLTGADLRSANLKDIKKDFFAQLLLARSEMIIDLYHRLIKGKIDGGISEGEGIFKSDPSSPIENWILVINEGDTPLNNQISSITAEWMHEFIDEHNIIIPKYKITSSIKYPDAFRELSSIEYPGAFRELSLNEITNKDSD